MEDGAIADGPDRHMINLVDVRNHHAGRRHGRRALRRISMQRRASMQRRGIHRIQRRELLTNLAHDGSRIANRPATGAPLRRSSHGCSNMCLDACPHEHPLRMPVHAAVTLPRARLLMRNGAQPRDAAQRHICARADTPQREQTDMRDLEGAARAARTSPKRRPKAKAQSEGPKRRPKAKTQSEDLKRRPRARAKPRHGSTRAESSASTPHLAHSRTRFGAASESCRHPTASGLQTQPSDTTFRHDLQTRPSDTTFRHDLQTRPRRHRHLFGVC
jgi:hypothetical protein